MKDQLQILHLEDSISDRDLIQQMLLQEGIDCQFSHCVDREHFVQEIQKNDFDLIFADCTMPGFSGFHALELSREHAPHTPFIFVSGSIGEDRAIESLRNGATDYVLKNRLSRLVPAVRRAVAESEERARNQEMEQQLRQAQRLEAVGTLAGGVAHDFNNILTIIKGHVSLLLMPSGKADRVREIAATIDCAARRGTELVSQLLVFARKSEGVFTATDINERVKEITAMLREAISRNIAFELQLGDPLPDIHADPGQVDRVLINLATNARDAMTNGGKIVFSTSRVGKENVPFSAVKDITEYLCLSVADTGSGMSEATRQRIFEPFFTTKLKGKGTGLGMPVVYGLMKSHNGFIDVQTELGKGTTISLFFPIPTEPSQPPVELPQDLFTVVDGTETILVVDDESDVSYFVEVILKSHGYDVLLARNAEQALDLMRAREGQVDLIFSDIGLPKLDGFGLSHQAKKINPDVKVILTSGYADGGLKTKLGEAGVEGFIAKPYDMAALMQTIRTVLDKVETH